MAIFKISILLAGVLSFGGCTVPNRDIEPRVEAEVPSKPSPLKKKTVDAIYDDTVYHMAADAGSMGDGSVDAPFKTFARALEALEDGDTLLLSGGTYTEPIQLKGLERKITIKGKPGESAVLRGTRPLPKAWVAGKNGVWSQVIDFDVWQLFNGDELVYLARWPDASFEDNSMWRMTQGMRSADGGYDRKKKEFFGKCREGVIYDKAFSAGLGEGFHEGDSRYDVVKDQVSLADSGKDFTGAVAMLNIGHWLSWARPITRHASGSDHFEYDPQGELPLMRFFAWYVLGLEALDRPNEWWFDHETKTVYYMPSLGVDPNTLPLEGRVKDWMIELKQCSGLRFENLTFFSGGFWMNECEGIHFEDCRFLFAATHKVPLGIFDWFAQHNAEKLPAKMPSVYGGANNTFLNCEFGYCNAPIYFGGDGDRVENCYFHDIEWDLLSNGGSGSAMLGNNAQFIRNTLVRTGNSEGVRPVGKSARVELVHMWDMGNLQHDGAAVNVSTKNHEGTYIVRNWAHDCNRQGLRFDYHDKRLFRPDGKIYGDGVFMYNVSWKTQPNQVKGDRHLVLNNTVVDVNRYPDPTTEEFNMSVQGFKCMHEIEGNAASLTRNNLANLSHRGWNFDDSKSKDGWWVREDGYKAPSAYTIPGVEDHNMREKGAAFSYLRDPINYDFRPKKGSPLVDGGAPVKAAEVHNEFITFEPLSFLGSAPDVGAYEYGATRYWIPGCKLATASTPIPRDGAVDVPLDADLMFLEAYKTTQHTVYFGGDPNSLKPLRKTQTGGSNIVKPPQLVAGQTYYWRVDALQEDGEVVASPVWSFGTRQE